MAEYSLPPMTPAATAKLKEHIATYQTDFKTGETDMSFPDYLRTQYPDAYRAYLELNGQGKQNK